MLVFSMFFEILFCIGSSFVLVYKPYYTTIFILLDAIPWTQPPVVLGQTTPSSILFNVPTLGNLDRGNVTRLGLAYRFLGSSTSMWSDVLFGHVTYPSPAGRGQDDVMRLFNLEPGTLYSVYLYNVSQGQHSPLSQSVIVSTLPAGRK